MNKMSLTLAELPSQQVTAEGIIKNPSVNIIEKSYARSKPKGKGKKKWVPKGQKVENVPNGGVAKAHKGTGPKPKGKCFHCGMAGHWKWNCADFLPKKKTARILSHLFLKLVLLIVL